MSAPAAAHLGAPEGRVPFVDGDTLTGGGTTWGIVSRESGCFQRTCEEALNGPPGFYYKQPGSERIVIGRSDGVWLTDDYGCSLTAGAPNLADKNPQVFIASRSVPAVLYVATADSNGSNGVFKSTDDGETFVATFLAGLNVSFRSLATSPDGAHVWATGLELETREPLMWVSDDGGATFASVAPWPVDTAFATLVGFDEDVGEPAISLIDGTGVGSQLSLVSVDGTTLTPIGTFEGVASDFTAFNDRYLVIENRSTFHVRLKTAQTFVEMNGPSRCLLRLPGDDFTVWGCGQPFQQGHYLTSEDGEDWTPVLGFLEIVERRCPEGTVGAERCAYLFPPDAGPGPVCPADAGVGPTLDAGAPGVDAGVELDAGGAGAVEPAPPNACPCSSTDSEDAPLVGVLALAWLLLRRRRARR